MKDILYFAVIATLSASLLYACGPSEEELQQQELMEQQAHEDSLEQVRQAELEEMRRDSLARAEAEREARLAEEAAEAEPEPILIEYAENGPFTVQVQSWRSEEKARQRAELWRTQGFEHAYVVKHGDESTGDVWFRVRIGNVATIHMAERLQKKLNEEFNTESWVDELANEG
ncbi:MAG: SPOR domain-containing protein [Balneolaceae bacterium]